MAFSLDFLGFGSKRKTAFRILDLEWAALDLDVRIIDNGVRQLLYQWAVESTVYEDDTDRLLLDLANFAGFLMRGPERAERLLGPDRLAAMEQRVEEAVALAAQPQKEDEESLDIRVIKLMLTAGLADSGIQAAVSLDENA